MTRASSRARLAILLSASFAGIFVAHAIDYWLLMPSAAHRHELLLGTGHGYWPYVGLIALIAAVIGCVVAVGAGFGRTCATPDFGVLALMQSGGFVALEAVERIGAGGYGRSFGVLLALGVCLQVVVAFVVSKILRAAERVGVVLRAQRPHTMPPYRPMASVAVDAAWRISSWTGRPYLVRGPPLPTF